VPEHLLAFAGELRHRGPDGVGLYLDLGFGMVHTRLATMHAEESDQPLPDERGRYWVMQDGEIYNAPALRDELCRLGHRFSTWSDTEVLVHAYEEWGTACLERLNGAFAIALWDRMTAELLLARDRFGISPLFLSEVGGVFCFASEAKALLRHQAALREFDPLALVEAFTLWASAPDRSPFMGIRELPGGHYLRVGAAGILEQRRWWELPLAEPQEISALGQEELAEELAELLADAVRIRLQAAVPVGTYLSGGLDSSAVTALADRAAGRPLPAFALGFADRRFDETPEQDRVAGALGVSLSRSTMSAAEIAELLPRVVELIEMPTLRTAPAPLLRLSAAAREAGCRVVLTGEGADELFAGYDIFKLDQVRRFWARQPDSRLRPLLLNRLYGYLSHDLHRAGALLQGAFRSGLTETADPLYSHRPRFEKGGRLLGFFSAGALERARREGEPTERLRARLPAGFEKLSELKRAQYLEISTFLTGYLLHAQGDRMLMGNSVAGRFPFLDHRVAAFAARIPDALQLRGLREKYLLRRAVAPLLPAEIVQREKRPYRAPILTALLGPGAPDYVAELTQPARLAEAGIFLPHAVGRLLAKCRRNAETLVGEVDEMALVGIISVMLLHEQFIVRPKLAVPATPTRVVVGSKISTPNSLYHDPSYEEAATPTPA
jgi:asparagine synthase (glutamine-hydrolysing)